MEKLAACHLKCLDPVNFPPEPLPSVLCSACVGAIQMLCSPPKLKSCGRLMKIWLMNSRRKTFSLMDVVTILFWSLSLWSLVCNTGLTPVARSYRQYLNTTISCSVNETLRLSPVKEMRLSIPKTGSVNVAYVIAFLSFFRRENAIVKDTIGTFMESNGIPPGCHGNLHMQTPLN